MAWFSRGIELPTAFEFALSGGLRAYVRPVRADDAPRFASAFPRLSEASRRQRFFGQASALSQMQLDFLTAIDPPRHAAWAALDLDREAENEIGVARYIRTVPAAGRSRSASAEVAITILDAYQHRGAGRLLHACLHLTAARHGIARFIYDVSQDNARFLAHLRALGAVPQAQAEHIVHLEMPVYARAGAVPRGTEAMRRFAELLRVLERVPAVERTI
jgi:hypothetical protein